MSVHSFDSRASESGSAEARDDEAIAARRAAMAVVARATLAELAPVTDLAGSGVADLRAPEIGLVMVRGRVGGDGAPFNLGEATVTRAAVRLASGATGFGQLLGRDKAKARLAAILDALWVEGDLRGRIEAEILAPIRARLAVEGACRAEEVAATRVDFFTLVRGDD